MDNHFFTKTDENLCAKHPLSADAMLHQFLSVSFRVRTVLFNVSGKAFLFLKPLLF